MNGRIFLGVVLALIICAATAQNDPTTRDVALEQKLDAQVPLDLPFRDEAGNIVRLRDYFGDKPVVLAMVWYRCPGICTPILEGMTDSLSKQEFTLGKEYVALTVSIDPREGPELAEPKKEEFVELYGRPGAEEGWHWLTGSETSIRKLAASVGYKYKYDKGTDQYAHPAGIIVLTPQGKVSRYLYGLEYNPRDLGFALMDASHNKIGTLVQQILLTCYHYDSTTGKYNFVVTRVLQAGGLLTMLVLGASVFVLSTRHRRRAVSDLELAEPDREERPE